MQTEREVTARQPEGVDVLAQKLAATVVAHMIREAAFQGETVTAAEISHCFVNDPQGSTATYAIRTAVQAVDWFKLLKSDPDVYAFFNESAVARCGGVS